ncbi:alpha-2-macroglobulin family protein [Robertkochia solimangrovi]|uniref:alpha-2-macroglobulin family protein n=1 Tax=Robertkochia solimangrovi TaxID=2213046 RepID=UPI00117FD46B|nr:MG2 domain-containing protein [Robertkochia solimangrovi]TRZ42155.1 hypothetical protein DMZ48_14060 [Robertkochia solimangrovi]
MLLKKIVLLFLLSITVISCNEESQTTQEQKDNLFNYREYISEVSPGLISSWSDIRIVLHTPVQGWTKDMQLDDDLLTIKPRVKGKVVALNNQTIAFIPAEKLTGDTEYTLLFDLKSIRPDVGEELEEFTFHVKTIKQQFSVNTDEIQSYDSDFQYMTGIFRSSDKLTAETAQQLISVHQGDKELKVKFDNLSDTGTQLHFTIDSIQRFVDDSEILVTWDGKPAHIDSQGSATVKIPGKNNFTVIDVDVIDGKEQFIRINFSNPLKKGQQFDGLVVLENTEKLRFSVSGNILRVYTGKRLSGTNRLEVFQGIESEDGYKLKHIYNEMIAFEQIKPNVRFLSNATILPSSTNLKINFETVNLKAIDVTVIKIFENNILQFLQVEDLNAQSNLRRVGRPVAKKVIRLDEHITGSIGKWRASALDLSEIINPEPGAIYRVVLDFKKEYSTYVCENTAGSEATQVLEEEIDFDDAPEESSYWDNAEYYENWSGYNWRERDDPCTISYYYDKEVTTNILATDLGLTVKKGENLSYFVSVNDLVSTQPLPGVEVTFYNFQQQPIGKSTTDQDGFAIFDSPSPAFFAVASSNNQKTYLKLEDGNALSVSNFDVSGFKLKKGIKGYIYGERGVWRPGDTLFLSFILDDKANDVPDNHPVKFELSDPYGKVIKREILQNGINNFYTVKAETDANAPTGNWRADFKVGGVSFHKILKIETIKPNRLKIKAAFEEDELKAGKAVNGSLEVTWLHGAIARNLKADINAKFTGQSTTFSKFNDFTFDDPTRKFKTEELEIFKGKIDNEGKADFTVNPQLTSKAPGKLKASFITKVYENGGDFSTDVFSETYSPYQSYVGIKAPKGDRTRGMLLTDTPHRFQVAAVNEDGSPRSAKGLKVNIYKIDWRWWWNTSEENFATFNSESYHDKVFNTTVSTGSDGHGEFKFEIKYPAWGRYLVHVEDPVSGHTTGKVIYIDWPGWAGKSQKNDPTAATMLVFSTDKDTYQPGDKAVITFPSSEDSRALLTVENGTEVIDAMWIPTVNGETKYELPVKNNYTPNVYIHISLLQPHANTLNDNPIRMYGVVPIKVNDPETILEPVISMPEVLRPEEKVTIEVSEKNGREMTYTVAVVDEGLLDLTRFKTPDPWSTFYARQALGVKTWDIYDDVIGAFGGRIDQVFSIGGDESLAGAKNKKANRFEPMVRYLGPFHLAKGKTAEHTLKIPKYIGSVRTMVIAGDINSGAFGNSEVATPVRKPLMVLASLPRKVTPGETVTLPVTVFAMESKVKNASVRIKSNNAFENVGETVQSISFAQPDEKMTYFELKIKEGQPIGKITVEVSGNGEKASYDVEVDVVNPNPVSSEINALILEPGTSQEIPVTTFGIVGSNSGSITFSTLPSMNLSKRLSYLINYPHGCVEQTTSAAFPQLFLSAITDLTQKEKQAIDKNIKDAINRLRNFQLPGGGFSYWAGQGTVSDWGTSYAGHFLLEAEKKGYVLPIGFKSSWIDHQRLEAKRWRNSLDKNGLSQAYRLFTLALAGQADISSMNRLRETPGISNDARHRLAAAYAMIGQKSAASEIYKTVNTDFIPVKYDYFTYGDANRNRAMALETLILLDQKEESREMAEQVAGALDENRWMSTQTTAYSLLSMAKFAAYIGGKEIKASYTLNGKNESVSTTRSIALRPMEINDSNNTLKVKNEGSATLFINVLTTGILPVGEEQVTERNLKAVVTYKGKDGTLLSIDNLMQGTDFIAEVTISNLKGVDIQDVALTEIFPSGWEIVNTRFTDFGDFAENPADHTDLRDDRAMFYFDLKSRETKTFRILLNASYLGTYYLPGVQADAMYDNEYSVRTSGRWIKVIP